MYRTQSAIRDTKMTSCGDFVPANAEETSFSIRPGWLVLDRERRGGPVRMRIAHAAPPSATDVATGETRARRKTVPPDPIPPPPITLRQELAERLQRWPVDEVVELVVEYLDSRYGVSLEIDELELRGRIADYLANTSAGGWNSVARLGDAFADAAV